ncbi:MAG: hypothetical protein GVY18_08010 [Bacteroidetes bacterium]|jgi:hypothetical protein|nr:hypothetical protein [Bacteroidota bacterium]
MAERTYTKQEVFEIIERAVELQVQTSRTDDERAGLTHAELETVAREAGLDPALLQQAAAELDEPGNALFEAKAGTTATHVFVERWMPGALTPEVWEDVVGALRQRFDSSLGSVMGMPGYGRGVTEKVGRTLEWKHTSLSGIETQVMLRPRGDGVRMRLNQRVGWGSPVTESMTYGAGLVALLVLFTAPLGVAATALIPLMLVAIPLILLASRAWRQKKHQELEELADHLSTLVATHAKASAPRDGQAVAEQDGAPSVVAPPSLLDDDHASDGKQVLTRRTRT